MSERKNYDYYKRLQQIRGDYNFVYNKKEYPRGFTRQDKSLLIKIIRIVFL